MTEIKIELIRKITIAAINGVRRAFRDIKGRTLQGRIFGVARNAVVEDSGAGIAIKFTGDFRALNAQGERFTGPVCYLPAQAEKALADALAAYPDAGVEFAFDLYAVQTLDALGYTWEFEELFTPSKSDPYQSVMEKLKAHPFVLPSTPIEAEAEKPEAVTAEAVAEEATPAKPTKAKAKA